MAKIVLNDALGTYNVTQINLNATKIEEALNDKVLYRDNPDGEPNTMETPLDMNAQPLYNLRAPQELHEPARWQDVKDVVAGTVNSSLIPFTPYLDIGSTNVQGAIQEVKDDVVVLQASSGIPNNGSVTDAKVASGAGIDATKLAVIQSGAGAVVRTVSAKLRESISIEDFDALPSVAIPEIRTVINARLGGKFSAGAGTYSSTIKIVGQMGYAMAYDQKFAPVTSPNTATNAFEFGNSGAFVAGSYRNEYTVKNIVAVGAGKTGTSAGIRQFDAANVRIHGAMLSGFNKGLHLYSALSSSYYDMTMTGNAYGIYAEAGTGLTLAEPNANSFYGLRIYGNDRAVGYLGGANAGILWSGCNFEGNNLAGNATDGRAVISMTGAGQQTFISTHHEGNLGQYGTYFDGADQGKTLTMIGVEHIDSTGTQVHIQTGCLAALGSRIFGNTSTHQVFLNTGTSATLIESETTCTGDLSNMAAIRFGKMGFGVNPTTGSPCISAGPAAIANALGSIASDFAANETVHKWSNAAGTRIAYFGFYDNFDHDFVADGARGWNFWSNGAKIAQAGRMGALIFAPGTDNSIKLGAPAFRWQEIYAANGTINTSDEREKAWRGALSPAELSASKEIAQAIGAYQWHASVAEKGIDGARYHVGVKAQQVVSILASHGLDPMRYGFVCYDEWGDQFEKDGSIIVAAGNRYGIRPDQLAFFIAAGQEQRLAALELLLAAS